MQDNKNRMLKGLLQVEQIVGNNLILLSLLTPVVCRHIEQKWTELLRELEERLDQEKETGQKEVGTYCTITVKIAVETLKRRCRHEKLSTTSYRTFDLRQALSRPPLFGLILLCAFQSRQLVAMGQKKASSHSLAIR